MEKANLNPKQNLWFAVFDFSDESKKANNWSLLTTSEEESLWCPLGPAQNCCPKVEPRQMGHILGQRSHSAEKSDQSIEMVGDREIFCGAFTRRSAPTDFSFPKKNALHKIEHIFFAASFCAAEFWRRIRGEPA